MRSPDIAKDLARIALSEKHELETDLLRVALAYCWDQLCYRQNGAEMAAIRDTFTLDEGEPSALQNAAAFALAAQRALEDYEADHGEPLPDGHELGRISESRGSPSFRIQVGHVRRLAAAVSEA